MTEALWYAARGTGVACLVLLSVVVCLGIGGHSGRPVFGLPRFAVTLVHRNAALLAVTALTVHIVCLMLDPYAQLAVADLIVPFDAAYRPMWVGLGAVASDLVLAIVATSLLRHRLGARAWRGVHWLAYAAWPVAVLHGLGSGTDRGQAWLWAVTAACGLPVVAAAVWRLALAAAVDRDRRPAASIRPPYALRPEPPRLTAPRHGGVR